MSEYPSEIEALRKAIDALRDRMDDRDMKFLKPLGFSEGWQTLMQLRFDRLEQRLDNLVLELLRESRRKGDRDKEHAPPSPPSTDAPAVPKVQSPQ